VPPRETQSYSLSLPAAVHARLRRVAAQRGESMATLIRQALSAWLREHEDQA
jgi:predicted DNA-binding protein